ncbi:Prion-like-(Q/N-rich) domain-bearing protein 25 [Trichinella nelsoni]|uniref:Prion-like-(Q/N-rich) domain-bearing protein 25 n=1 Tax=Trichinella nelsoni TaxID=6336 RepID=A0A0V0RI11_9BILA|nr:Prion-like-(Q/N-rich) domain-bearing protein 25 [Trichinella nelsoni]
MLFSKFIFSISFIYLAVSILGDDSSLRTIRNISAKLTSDKQHRQTDENTNSAVVPKLFVGSTAGVVPPGGICSDDEDCSGYPFAFCMGNCMCKDFAINAGSTCSMNKGNCGIGQVYVSEAGICMNVASPGSPCQYSQQCSGAEVGAFCISMRCRCVYGMTETSDGKCTFINSNCTHRGMIWIAELGECKPVIAPGARSCTHRQQCTASYRDSHCFMTQCSCPPERPIAVDGTCGISCSVGQTYSGVLNRCVPTAQPGDRCQYSSQCHALFPGTICDRSICRCPNDFYWTGTHCTDSCPDGYQPNPKTGVCKPGCREGQIDYEGECLNQVSPDHPCIISAQCTGGSSCTDGRCQCPPGKSSIQGVCTRAKSRPGGSCEHGEECTDGSYCLKNRCVCPKGFVLHNQRCTTPLLVPPESACGPDVACGGGSFCVNNICTCPNGYIVINQQCQLPDAVPPGSKCTETDHCSGGSFCLYGICRCPTGMVIVNQRCQIPIEVMPGHTCRVGIDICIGRSYCVEGTCRCPEGMVIERGICRSPSIVLPGFKCDSMTHCGGGSVCVDGVCTCPKGMTIINQRCEMAKTAPPNYSCRNQEICTGGSSCVRGVCICPKGQIPVGDICKGSPDQQSKQRCVTDDQCVKGFSCVSSRCVCAGMLLPNGVCKTSRLASLGSKCVAGLDVCTGGSSCIGGTCTCPSGTIAIDGRCRIRKREMLTGQLVVDACYIPQNFTCFQNTDCTGGAFCQNGVCVCPGQTLLIDEICQSVMLFPPSAVVPDPKRSIILTSSVDVDTSAVQPRARLLESCTSGQLCINNSTCLNGTCQCPVGYYAAHYVCRRKTLVLPGDPCDGATLCGHDSKCVDGRCVCHDGFEIVNRRCRKTEKKKSGTFIQNSFTDVKMSPHLYITALPGERCDRNTVCTGGAFCEQGKCTCSPGFEVHEGICKWKPIQPATVAYPGQRCVEGVTKCLNDSTCLLGTCTCPPGFVLHDKYCKLTAAPLLDWAMPGQLCNSQTQCRGDSTCIGGLCTCPVNQVIINNECTFAKVTVSPGFSCDANSICTGGSTCIGGICQCPTGESIEGYRCVTRISVAISSPPGSYCRPDIGVCTGGSYCRNNVCVCPQEKIAIANQCVSSKEQIALPVLGMKTEQCGKELPCRTGMICVDGMCRCKPGSTFDPATATCIYSSTQNNDYPRSSQPVTPGKSCISSKFQYCVGGAICENGYCLCPQGTVHVSDQCQSLQSLFSNNNAQREKREVKLGAQCAATIHCNRGAICVRGICTCPQHWKFVDNYCVPLIYASTQSMIGGSACSDDRCVCPEGSELKNYVCSSKFLSNRSGFAIPNRIPAFDTPQMVILTFDDPINEVTFDLYRQLFDGRFRNPNGCPIKATFFVSHEYNNYHQTQWMYWKGHEIAVNSITDSSVEDWIAEMAGLRKLLQQLAAVNVSTVQGIRAPQLSVGGNAQFTMMQSQGFLYDNSMSVNPGKDGPAYWPQTLDYRLSWHCEAAVCPDESFPGIWAVPINQFYGNYINDINQYMRGAMVRAVMTRTSTPETVLRLLLDNFNRHYRTNRAPFVLTLNADFLRVLPGDGGYKALERFLAKLSTRPDVWVITMDKLISWMRMPTPLSKIKQFAPWQCDDSTREQARPCQVPRVCSFETAEPDIGNRWISTCAACPLEYPWAKRDLFRRINKFTYAVAMNGIRVRLSLTQSCGPASNVPQPNVHYYQSGDPCNIITDKHLMVNPNIQTAYLQCVPSSHGLNGRWQAVPCPPGQTFQFGKQRCDFDFTQVAVRADDGGVPALPSVLSSAVGIIFRTLATFVGQPCDGKYCFGGSECHSEKGICTCPKGTVLSGNSQFCHGETAAVHLENEEIFTRAKNFTLQASPGSSCKHGEVCSGGSKCDPARFVCTCDDGTVDHDGRCVNIISDDSPASPKLLKKSLGDRCEATNPLHSCPPGASCVSGICACISPMIQDGDHCRPLRASVHQKASQLCQGGSVCSSVTLRCACPLGTKETDDHCVDISSHKNILASVGEHCEANTDCIHGAYCHTGSGKPHCECLSTHVELDRSCLRVIYPGQHGCSSDKQCSAVYNGASCKRGICVCPEGTGAVSQTCSKDVHNVPEHKLPEATTTELPSVSEAPVYSASSPGGTCTDSAQCLGGSKCYMNICVCPEQNMHAVNGICIYKTPPVVQSFVTAGSRCNGNQICAGGSTCSNGICICGHGTVQQGNKCIKTFMTGIQLPTLLKYCISDNMCKGNSICINTRCACPNGMRFVNGQCVPGRNYVFSPQQKTFPAFASCTHDTDCKSGSVCVQGRCVCPPDTQMTTDGYCESYQLGSDCNKDENCGRQAICISGRCRCAPGTNIQTYEAELMKNEILMHLTGDAVKSLFVQIFSLLRHDLDII